MIAISPRGCSPITERVARLLRLVPVWLALACAPAAGIDTLFFQTAVVEGPGWRAQGVQVQLAWKSVEEAALQVSASSIELPPPLGRVQRVELTCTQARVTSTSISCTDGHAHVESPQLDRPDFPVTFRYEPDTGVASVSFRQVAVASGRVAGGAEVAPTGWRAHVEGTDVRAERIRALLDDTGAWPAEFSGAGRLTFAAQVAGSRGTITEVEVRGGVRALTFSGPTAGPAGEAVSADVDLHAEKMGMEWEANAGLVMHEGDLLVVDPIVLSPRTRPLSVRAVMNWQPEKHLLRVSQLEFDHPQTARVEGHLQLDVGQHVQLQAAELRLVEGYLSGFYESYIQPLVLGTALDSLDTSGRVQGEVHYQSGVGISLAAVLDNVRFKDRKGRFEIAGLTGKLGWSSAAEPVRSRLDWNSGSLYRLQLGAARIAFETRGRSVSLVEPADFQVLDGKLLVETFDLENSEDNGTKWRFDAVLSPLSMEAFSTAMGWPTMAGQLSGVVPSVAYADGRLSVGGVLLLRVFDGAVTIRDLVLERPFGIASTLSADIDMKNLDLDALTRTFAFGKIEGRLDGRIRNLQMVDWRPVAFDAWFATPSDDTSRHRISQKAVDNLTSLGGGIGGVLSRSYLRFFEEFYYNRIGLSCRLQNGICIMDGVAPAKNGYYIVKGGGLPRIDVVGYTRRVNWDELIERLKRVTLEKRTVIQ